MKDFRISVGGFPALAVSIALLAGSASGQAPLGTTPGSMGGFGVGLGVGLALNALIADARAQHFYDTVCEPLRKNPNAPITHELRDPRMILDSANHDPMSCLSFDTETRRRCRPMKLPPDESPMTQAELRQWFCHRQKALGWETTQEKHEARVAMCETESQGKTRFFEECMEGS